MTGQPEGQGKGGTQRKGGFRTDNKERSILKAIMNVRKAIHWVPAILEGWMSQVVEELVKSGQQHNLMIAGILRWESTTTAEIQMGILVECGVTPLIQIRCLSTAMSQNVCQR